MHGDFSVLNFDPHEHERGVEPARQGVLRNVSGVLHQQGRVTTDADLTEGELLGLRLERPGRRATSSAPASARCRRRSPTVSASIRRSSPAATFMSRCGPGRAWADGILTRLAGMRRRSHRRGGAEATYFGPPIATSAADARHHRRRRARRGDPRGLGGGAAWLPVSRSG